MQGMEWHRKLSHKINQQKNLSSKAKSKSKIKSNILKKLQNQPYPCKYKRDKLAVESHVTNSVNSQNKMPVLFFVKKNNTKKHQKNPNPSLIQMLTNTTLFVHGYLSILLARDSDLPLSIVLFCFSSLFHPRKHREKKCFKTSHAPCKS